MALGNMRIMTIIVAVILSATCVSFAAEGLSGSPDRPHGNIIVMGTGELDDEPSIGELVLLFEGLSAKKKYYESKGFIVFIDDHSPNTEDMFKTDLVQEMMERMGAHPVPDGEVLPFDEGSTEPRYDMNNIGTEGMTFPAMMKPIKDPDQMIDLEFLKNMMDFLRDSNDERSKVAVGELTAAYEQQKLMQSKLLIILASGTLSFIDVRSFDVNRKQSEEIFGSTETSVCSFLATEIEDDGSDTDETFFQACDTAQPIFLHGEASMCNAGSATITVSVFGEIDLGL